MATQFTSKEAREAIESGKVVVLDFWATWCGPCMKLGPIIDELEGKYKDKAIVAKVNVDDDNGLSSEFKIVSIPTVLFFKNGELVDRSVGLVKLTDLERKLMAIVEN